MKKKLKGQTFPRQNQFPTVYAEMKEKKMSTQKTLATKLQPKFWLPYFPVYNAHFCL